MTYRALTVQDYEEAAEEYGRDVEIDLVHRFFVPTVGDPLQNALPFEVFFDVPAELPVGQTGEKS